MIQITYNKELLQATKYHFFVSYDHYIIRVLKNLDFRITFIIFFLFKEYIHYFSFYFSAFTSKSVSKLKYCAEPKLII